MVGGSPRQSAYTQRAPGGSPSSWYTASALRNGPTVVHVAESSVASSLGTGCCPLPRTTDIGVARGAPVTRIAMELVERCTTERVASSPASSQSRARALTRKLRSIADGVSGGSKTCCTARHPWVRSR
eukprot:scaffold272518_cov30-Tisochrysis_lutea.AAC.4